MLPPLTPPRLLIPHRPKTSSRLSLPTDPFTPLSPLHALSALSDRTRQSIHHSPSKPSSSLPHPVPAPQTPLTWQWTCHACHTAYALGATRRCLEDGHFFCAGESVVRKKGKTRRRKSKACGSAFDYQGWKGWGRWRRGSYTHAPSRGERVEGVVDTWWNREGRSVEEGEDREKKKKKKKKDCWHTCDYPSQCRWGRSVGVHTPSPTPTRTTFSCDLVVPDAPTLMLDTAMFESAMLHASLLKSCSPSLPTLDECFAPSPSSPRFPSCFEDESDPSPSSSRSARQESGDDEMLDAPLLVSNPPCTPSPSPSASPLPDRRSISRRRRLAQETLCIDPALLVPLSCTTNVHAAAVRG
ncbi:hypothetical protein SVAN01_09519 [Stagonosporopsis vannaccii]|nr:hypothetical protein SVAN01_09519 [Stagonosporopsis vannaccii]